MRESNLLATLEKWLRLPGQAGQTLETLRRAGRVQVVVRRAQRLWSISKARFEEY
jgi:hypothetical protein